MLPLIEKVQVRGVLVPFRLQPRSASGSLPHAAIALIDLHTTSGQIGHSYVFAYLPGLLDALIKTTESLALMLKQQPLAPQTVSDGLRRQLTLIDTPGLVGIALAGLDMAMWDAYAKLQNLPLATLLGSNIDRIPCYNSCGLWIEEPAQLSTQAIELLQGGDFNAMKVRVGRKESEQDLTAIETVREAVGNGVILMSDFNQSQSVASAIQRCQQLDNSNLYWIEEPVRHADYIGTAAVRQAINTPIQTGENLCNTHDLLLALETGSADYYMPDVQRIGGVTGWQRAAAVCHAAEVSMSSHLFPEFSVHLLAATPTAHWLEYVDWAAPVLNEPLQIRNGHAIVPDLPGAGISWDEDAIRKFGI